MVQEFQLKHKGVNYPALEMTLRNPQGGMVWTAIIATESLYNVLNWENDPDDEAFDQKIYFYVPDDILGLPPKEIAEKHLDIPLEFVE